MTAIRRVRIVTRSRNDSMEHTHGNDAQGARDAATWTVRIDVGLIPVRHRPLRGEAVCRIPRPAAPIFRGADFPLRRSSRSEEHTSELQSLMRISYAVFCLQIKHTKNT